MDDHKDEFSIVKMSQTLGVSRSGYYRWRARGPSDRALENKSFTQQIRQIWEASGKTYGSPRIHAALLGRVFNPAGLAQALATDITYLPSSGGWLYLTTVMDLADRQIIGWSLAVSMKAEDTTIPAFKAACSRRLLGEGLLFHSDQGSQYACSGFTVLLDARGITQSMFRKGNCWDNAPAESFFKTLKAELPVELRTCTYPPKFAVLCSTIQWGHFLFVAI